MFGQNNIERQRLLPYIHPRFFFFSSHSRIFSPIAFSVHDSFSTIRGNNFCETRQQKGKEARSRSRSLPIFFHLTHLVTNTTCSIQKGLIVQLRFIFIFHFKICTSAARHTSRENSDIRTLVRNSYSRYIRPGAGNLHLPVEGWMALVRRNYLIVITTSRRRMTLSSDAILKIFSKI